jgi:hypothetical protein
VKQKAVRHRLRTGQNLALATAWTHIAGGERVPGTCEKIDFTNFAIMIFQWVTL